MAPPSGDDELSELARAFWDDPRTRQTLIDLARKQDPQADDARHRLLILKTFIAAEDYARPAIERMVHDLRTRDGLTWVDLARQIRRTPSSTSQRYDETARRSNLLRQRRHLNKD